MGTSNASRTFCRRSENPAESNRHCEDTRRDHVRAVGSAGMGQSHISIVKALNDITYFL